MNKKEHTNTLNELREYIQKKYPQYIIKRESFETGSIRASRYDGLSVQEIEISFTLTGEIDI